MAEAAKRASASTDLYVGTLKAAVGLFGTNAKPVGLPEGFDTAGPNGGKLRFEQRGVAAPEPDVEPAEAPVAVGAKVSDPFADGGVAEAIVGNGEPAVPDGGVTVPGEFRRVLVEEGTGIEVEPDQVRRGVRLEDGKFVDCTQQLAAIDERTKLDRMDIVRTIDSTQIRRERVVGSYYLGAQDPKSVARLRLLYDALKRRREVAIVKWTSRKRQSLGVVAPNARTGTLMVYALVWAEDWREPHAKAKAIQSVEFSSPEDHERYVARMEGILVAMHGHVDDLDVLRDDAIALREELLVRAQSGEMDAEVVEALPVEDEDVDLEAALTESLAAVRAGKL